MPGCHRSSRFVAPLAAALLLSSTLLGGCYGGRSTIPSGPQRISEAEGRKTRQEREAAEAKALAAQAAAEQKAANERAEADRALLEKKIAAEQAAQQKKAAEAKVLAEKLALEKKAAEQAKAAEAKTAADQATLDKTVAEADTKLQGAAAGKKATTDMAVTAAKTQAAQPVVAKNVETLKTAADKSTTGEEKKVVVQSAPASATKTTPGAVAASSLEVAKAPVNAPAATQESASATVAAASAEKPAKPYVAYVQIASFTSRANADAAAAWLKAHGYASARVVDVEQGDMALHRVQTGPYQDPVATHKALDELKTSWPQSFIPAD